MCGFYRCYLFFHAAAARLRLCCCLSCDQQGDRWQASVGASGDVRGLLLLVAARVICAQARSWHSRQLAGVILEVVKIMALACETQLVSNRAGC